jgi:hypothetical protein
MSAKKHTHRSRSKRAIPTLSARTPLLILAMLSIGMSFALGIQSAGDVETIEPLEAQTLQLDGDIDGDGVVDPRDAAAILEIALGYEQPTVAQLKADPNDDGQLTVDDALRILHDTAF